MEFLTIHNQEAVPSRDIPAMEYGEFLWRNLSLIEGHPERHCILYFGYKEDNNLRLICCIGDDTNHTILISSAIVSTGSDLDSFSARNPAFEKFEREIHENFGIGYSDHPWLKPVRYPENGYDKTAKMTEYPFFDIEGEELHEVGVGPVHAGIIEPGHFRFICNGEQILHLEIQLGYQHRGIEQLFLGKKKLLQRNILAESIAGDSVVGHTSAFAYLFESLGDIKAGRDILIARTIAQELERIAIHTGDLSAICTDVAYQLGSSVFGRLRTPLINFFQEWCGNRLAKGVIRAGYNPYQLTPYLIKRLNDILDDFEPDFSEMGLEISKLPSLLSRFERTGMLSHEQLASIGTVGMSARMNAVERDIRVSHPYGVYEELDHEPIIKHHGDVYSRVRIRREETIQSIGYIRKLLSLITDQPAGLEEHAGTISLRPGMFCLSLTEGWRGEICHAAITDEKGDLAFYKIKDPSFHNWLALALGVRNNEISDFPVSNKSFDLSYCGHDL
jgi:Ni,Fe-hydrogenase III large subunit